MTRPRVETLEYTPRRIVVQPAGQVDQQSPGTPGYLERGGGGLQPVDIVESLPSNLIDPESPGGQPSSNGQDGDITDAR